jgi:SH3-like domain-containing protein
MTNDNTRDSGDNSLPYTATVMTAWQATYTRVLEARAGERVQATGRVEIWHETPEWAWRWCRDSHGREGWTPDALLQLDGDEATLLADYDARELTVDVGTRLIVERELAGWARCHTMDGASGWVPLECLAAEPTKANGAQPAD